VGLPLLGRVEARKAGHALHTQLVSRLLADTSSWKITTQDGAAEPASTFAESLAAARAAD
jgi:UDP-3-O-acyl-N-acetylglucosamine deacetylase